MAAAPSLMDVPVTPAKPAIDLEWQQFPSTSLAAASAAVPAAAAAAPPAPPSATLVAGGIDGAGGAAGAAAGGEAPELLSFSPTACFMPSFYKAMFDVDTVDVLARMREAAVVLTPRPFLELVGAKPDLYGPIWIAATLVFIISAASNFASYLNFHAAGGDALSSIWRYDFKLVTLSLFTVYGFTLGAPLAAWVVASYLGVGNLVPTQLICLYGYAVTTFLPVALLCSIPSTIVQWLLVTAAILASALFIVRNLYPVVKDQLPPQSLRTLLIVCGAGQAGFGVVLKMFFFTWN